MIGAVLRNHVLDIAALVEAAPAERNRECLHPRGRRPRGVMQDSRRIQTAAEPHAERHVGVQVLLHRLLQQRIQLFAGRAERVVLGVRRRQGPIRFRAHFAVAPLHPRPRHHLEDSLDHGPGRGNVVQREVAVEGRQAEIALDLGMNQDGLQLGAEVKLFAVTRDIQRLDAYAIAGQHQPPGGVGPDADRKHAAQLLEAGRIPLQKRV